MVNPHKFMTPDWYEWTHENAACIHKHLQAWTVGKGIKSVLEVGCGMYPAHHEFFRDIKYQGMDKDSEVIAHCQRSHRPIDGHAWSCDDIQLSPSHYHYSLVFSHSVIDHSPDPDDFIRKSIESSFKYIYIMSYRGYFAGISNHTIEGGRDGFCYDNISIPQVRRLLDGLGHKYELQEVPTGFPAGEIQSELHIIVEK